MGKETFEPVIYLHDPPLWHDDDLDVSEWTMLSHFWDTPTEPCPDIREMNWVKQCLQGARKLGFVGDIWPRSLIDHVTLRDLGRRLQLADDHETDMHQDADFSAAREDASDE